jgi:4-hydroxybenzoate polyprenyltransferase
LNQPASSHPLAFLLHTSIYTALCALALCLGAERIMLGYIPPLVSPLHALIGGSTLIEYNVHHLFNRRHDGPDWTKQAIVWHEAVLGIGTLLCLWALPHLSWHVLEGCAVLGLLSLAYSTPLLPFRYKARLKDYGLLKIHILTGVWVMVGTVLPALYWNIPLHDYWLEIIIRSLLIFPLCIAFDIRDADADLARGIHTLPNTLGIKTAYKVINYNLAAYFTWAIIRCIYRYTYQQLIVYAVSGLAAWGAIELSRRKPHPFVYLALIDGVMLLYGGLQAVL